MEQIISQEKLDELENVKGQARGVAFKGSLEFILKDRGEEALRLIEEKMQELGYPFKHKEIVSMKFYPLSLYLVLQLVIERALGYGKKEFKEMGIFSSKFSIIMRLFMKHFASINNVIEQGSRAWRMYFTVGNLEVAKMDKDKRYLIVSLKNFPFDKLHCYIVEGFYSNVIHMITRKEVSCEETKCIHQGDDYNEFLFKW